MKKAEQSERTRCALISAAIRLFGERGYRATPLKAIGEAAGISHGVIPFHFGSKEGLLLAVVERCFEVFREAVLGPLRDAERDHGLGDLAALMDAQVRFGDEHPEIGRLFIVLMFESLGPSPELREQFRLFHARFHALGREWVEAGVARGTIRSDLDADAAVDAMLGFFTGVRVHSLLLGANASRARTYHEMVEILRSGILSDQSPRAAARRGGTKR